MTSALPVRLSGRDPRTRMRVLLAPVVLGVLVLGLWQLAVESFEIDPFVIPSPQAIFDRFITNISSIVDGVTVTGRNALMGLVIGAVIGIVGALLASATWIFDEMTAPLVAALSVIPIVALAPVLYTLYGAAAETARIIVAALSVIVPVYLNTLRGLRQVRPVHRDLMRSHAASAPQVARTVTLPTATPYVFTGLRIASSLAVISALIAEYFGGPVGGLGKSITSAAASSNYPLAWAYVLGAILLGLAFYVVTLLVERFFTRHTGSD
ncbi:MAG: ABC nitrate/sulfonate/bicarbonate transporter, inner membrane subunit [uncultured Nocardioidaceae bacterium]|uniref:ABC nitrate/sulfonate/bicarbonate transporter, inner membrane subunit n=1 Tax=uncultured Nocardioidaceae bacterium TaxID=253824 RepID=A0A6J4MIQ1_9ACTN|nr:MAG: ABC nitrate/sulfonate/bicarbonate transporter, inner membrane subunit [uncultured Nocardioidaceae bacterium]